MATFGSYFKISLVVVSCCALLRLVWRKKKCPKFRNITYIHLELTLKVFLFLLRSWLISEKYRKITNIGLEKIIRKLVSQNRRHTKNVNNFKSKKWKKSQFSRRYGEPLASKQQKKNVIPIGIVEKPIKSTRGWEKTAKPWIISKNCKSVDQLKWQLQKHVVQNVERATLFAVWEVVRMTEHKPAAKNTIFTTTKNTNNNSKYKQSPHEYSEPAICYAWQQSSRLASSCF